MALQIDPNMCSLCGDCKPVCPTRSVLKTHGIYMINPETCTECDGEPRCLDECASGSIFAL